MEFSIGSAKFLLLFVLCIALQLRVQAENKIRVNDGDFFELENALFHDYKDATSIVLEFKDINAISKDLGLTQEKIEVSERSVTCPAHNGKIFVAECDLSFLGKQTDLPLGSYRIEGEYMRPDNTIASVGWDVTIEPE